MNTKPPALEIDDLSYPESWRADHHAPLQKRDGSGGTDGKTGNVWAT